ncbi:hypothetical protein HDU78_000805 [Chytriomyces hyalinus]|nr:hypothetical protein HDU78_000805 [Chytriomyces hyalinus]
MHRITPLRALEQTRRRVHGIPAGWLRDACQCPQCVHPSTRQKLISTGSLTAAAHAARLEGRKVEWGSGSVSHSAVAADLSKDSHSHEFDVRFLDKYKALFASGERSSEGAQVKQNSPHKLWRASDFAAHRSQHSDIDYSQLVTSDTALLSLLQQLQSHGLAFVRNVPVTEADDPKQEPQLEKIISRMGCVVRDSFYGRTWNVKSIQQAKNIAYTSLDLGLHMDLLYFDSPPGIQFLHSLKNSVTGGESIFLDSYKAAQMLKAESPHHYKTLTRLPVTFHYDNDGHLMKQHRYTITENDINSDAPDGMRVFYSPPFQGPLEHVRTDKDMSALVEAMRAFEDILRRPDMTFEIRMEAGMLVVFHNLRVLHGRKEFDAASGERHFKGAYIDYDVMKDRLSVLSRDLKR